MKASDTYNNVKNPKSNTLLMCSDQTWSTSNIVLTTPNHTAEG